MHLAAMYLCGSVDRFNMFELAISRNGCWYRRVVSMPKTEVWLLRYGPRMYAVCCKESSWLGKEAFSTIQAGATGLLLQFNQQKQRCIAIINMMEITGKLQSVSWGFNCVLWLFGWSMVAGCLLPRILCSPKWVLHFGAFWSHQLLGPSSHGFCHSFGVGKPTVFGAEDRGADGALAMASLIFEKKHIYQQVISHHHAGRPGFAGWN